MATQPNLACSEVKSLHKVVLDLLQPVQAVLALQVNLRVLKMVPNDFPYQRIWGLKKFLACSEVKSLHEVVLDLLQPVEALLTVLKMVPNDSPYQKTWGFKNMSLAGS